MSAIDLDAARRFLQALAGREGESFTFQTLDDRGTKRTFVTSIRTGTFDSEARELSRLNANGAGVYVTVNKTDGKGRRGENVTGLRALFVDSDRPGALLPNDSRLQAFPPHVAVETSPGKHHYYWLLKDGEDLALFSRAQVALATLLGTDLAVKDLPRVMRVPGFVHNKGEPLQSKLIRCERPASLPGIFDVLIGLGAELPEPEPLASPPAPASSTVLRSERDVAREAERLERYAATVEDESIQGQNGSGALMRVVAKLKGLARDEGSLLAELKKWNERNAAPPWDEADLLRATKNSDAPYAAKLDAPAATPATPGFTVSDHLAWVELMQAYVTRTRDGASWDLQHPLRKDTARMFLMSTGMSAAAAQLAVLPGPQGALYAKYVDCAPGRPPSFTEGGHTVLNTFVPSSIRPEPGSWDTIRSVLAYITDGDEKALEWVLNWMAAGYQLPARRSRTAPVFYGNQRTGKTTAANVFFALLGPDNCIALRNEDIVGGGSRFTSAWATRLAVCVGEVDAAEVARATTLLKTMTGEPTVMLEAKGAQATPVDNHLKVILTSNQTCPVTVETGDTRWSLFFQGRSASAEYLAAVDELYGQTGTGGVRWSEKGLQELAAFAHYLAGLQVNFQLINRPFESRAREVVMAASMPSVPSFAAEVEAAGSLDAMMLDLIPEHLLSDKELASLYIAEAPGFTEARAVFYIYKTWAKGAGHRPLGDKKFVAELARVRPEWGHRGDDRRVRVGGRKRSGWTGIPREPSLRPRAIPVVLTPPEETPAPEQQHPNIQQAALVLGAEVA